MDVYECEVEEENIEPHVLSCKEIEKIDDDTKEAITSPANSLTFEEEISYEISRTVTIENDAIACSEFEISVDTSKLQYELVTSDEMESML